MMNIYDHSDVNDDDIMEICKLMKKHGIDKLDIVEYVKDARI